MSSAPKRLHEECGSNEFHPLLEGGDSSRVSKLPRTDPVVDRRSPLHHHHHHHHHLYRIPPPPPPPNNHDPFTPPPHPIDKQLLHRSKRFLDDSSDTVADFTTDSSSSSRKNNNNTNNFQRPPNPNPNPNPNPTNDPTIPSSLDPTTTLKQPSADLDSKDRDVDLHGTRSYDKDSDDAFIDRDATTERDKDGFTSSVQHRKRLLRPRGSPHLDPRFRSRSRDYDQSQEKLEVSSVVYKVGECMEELIKLRKEFEASQDSKNDTSSLNCPTLEIRIPAEFVTATNRQVRGGQLWGTDIYTDDSDLVAVLMHTGYCRPTASPPPSAIKELRATIRMLPPQDCYTSTLRNNVRSRAWGAAIGCSYRVERCCIVKDGGGTIDLEPCLTHTSSVEPTLAPVAVERTMTTRAAASNALRQQRFVREVTIQYNLCNEPWIKYSISIVADKGLKKPLFTSARLKKGEVLYLETHSNRYELCFTGEKALTAITTCQPSEVETDRSQTHNAHEQNGERSTVERDNSLVDVFRWSRCKKPLPQRIMKSIGIPLPHEYIEVLEENIDWEDVQWSQTGVWIAGKEYPLARVHFLSPN